ncbi:MAG: UDPGP type 1 family protein [Lachnospiraceae bacterium]|nr:UDPGP type 1 family protein [Lachnospiraceae bacterium]
MTDLNAAKKYLEENGQEQVLGFYDELDEAGKQKLLDQIEKLDMSLIGLVEHNDETSERGKLEPLNAVTVKEIEKNGALYKEKGLEAIRAGEVGAVLLAGGQGTRLGYDGPKGTVNIGETRQLYIFECLIKNLMKVTDEAGVTVPLYVMTSDKNNDETVKFFKEHDFFGYPESEVSFFIQDMAPSVDHNGKLLLEEKDSLSLSPNGNGGWYASMAKTGVLEDVKKRGVKWLNIFAVDNVLQQIADPLFVGAVIDKDVVCGAKVVRKNDPEERVGVLCLEDGSPSIVEYYEMTEEMRTLRDEEGELAYAFGVILNYLFRVDELDRIVNEKLMTHVVEKKIPYINEAGEHIKPETPNGYKFEMLILDMIHLVKNCLPYEVVREHEFAPIKNKTGIDSIESAKELLRKNGVVL